MEPQEEYVFTISATFERPLSALFYVQMLDDNNKSVMNSYVSFDPDDVVAEVKFTLNEYSGLLTNKYVRFNLTCVGSEPQVVEVELVEGQYKYTVEAKMKSTGPALGKATVLYTRALENVIYVGFNESLDKNQSVTNTSFVAYNDYMEMYPRRVVVNTTYIELRFAKDIDCTEFSGLSYTGPSVGYLASIKGSESRGVPNFDVTVDYDQAGDVSADAESRIVRNINRKRAAAKKSILLEDEAYSRVARLLAADAGLTLDKQKVVNTSFGPVASLFELFGLEAPTVVLVSNHASADSSFAFNQSEVTLDGLTHIGAGASSNISHKYVAVLAKRTVQFSAQLVNGDEPVANKSVSVGGSNFTTDGEGVFTGVLPWGTYPVYADGNPLNGTLEANGKFAADEVQTIRKPAAGTFLASVRVVVGDDSSTTGAEGVTVEALELAEDEIPVMAPVTTDASGYAKLWLPKTNGSSYFECILRFSHPDNRYQAWSSVYVLNESETKVALR